MSDETNDTDAALLSACRLGDADAAVTLLQQGAEPNQVVPGKADSCLIAASRQGHTAVVRLLLDKGGASHRQGKADKSGATALFVASQCGYLGVVQLLLSRRADPNQARRDNGTTPLMAACMCGHFAIAQLLAVSGATTTATTTGQQAGWTAHMLAARYNYGTLSRWLAAVAGWSPLEVAAGCRLHSAATLALRLGLIDPYASASTATASMVHCAATSTHLWPDQPPVCRETKLFARAAMASWSPARHWLYHATFRRAVNTVVLVAQRLARHSCHRGVCDRGSCSNDSRTVLGLPTLPPEVWLMLCTWLLRRHWSVC